LTGTPDQQPPLDRLVREHLPHLLRLAVRLTGSADAGEELAQETLARIAQAWPTYRGDAAFRTWVYRIAINVFRDGLRSRRRSSHRAAGPVPVTLSDPRLREPVAHTVAGELGTVVAAKVSALPPRQREVLILISIEGLSPRDAAEALGITEANVHSTLHLARQKLKSELADYLVEK
jgi:RNA polymerase sigma-70 factor (ECF subfamily)